jgi:hypothetical protein
MFEIFDEKLIPWSAARDENRLVITESAVGRAALPAGVRVSKRNLRGPRVTRRGPRQLGRFSNFTARWPQAGLVVMARVPIVVCVTGGRVDYQIGNYRVHCGEGYFLLLPAGSPHDDGARPHYACVPQAHASENFCDLLWINRRGRSIVCWTCHCRGAQHGTPGGTQ